MRSRQRDSRPAEVPDPDAAAEGGELEEARRRARRLEEIGEDILSRALSPDSARFIAQNRQSGGQ